MKQFVYKKIGESELIVKAYFPPDCKPQDKRPAVVLFYGGGWVGGFIDQFRAQSEYLASRGMVAMTPDYRVKSRHGSSPHDSVEDAIDAVKWVHAHSPEMGIDPNKIIVGGGSVGGHLALCTTLLRQAPFDKIGAYHIPKAMILFNPVVDTTESGFGSEKIGEKPEKLSPVHHIVPGLPPSILFHGTSDETVPFENARRFRDRMQSSGNICELVTYSGKKHGFFNMSFDMHEWHDKKSCFWETLLKAETFLKKYGYI